MRLKFLALMNMRRSHKDLNVYQASYRLAMDIFEISKSFPKEETYSLTDQIRRSSRSVVANIAEAFRKRRYEKAFIAKLSDAEAEVAETQTWLDFAKDCNYITLSFCEEANLEYEKVTGMLVNMIKNPSKWSFDPKYSNSQ